MLNINKILFPTDFSKCSDQAFVHALFLARQHNAELHMLHAIALHEDDPYNPAHHFPDKEEIHNRLKGIADSQMDALLEKYDLKDVKIKKLQKRGISPAPVILDYAREEDIDLIVMGTHGRRGISHILLGSVAEEVVRVAKCPVLTIREQKEPKSIEAFEKILVPVDFSEHSKSAVAHAKAITATYKARLYLLHVIEESIHPAFYVTGKSSVFELIPDIESKSKEFMAKLVKETKGPAVETEYFVLEGRAAQEIVKFSDKNDIDLIVIATHGLTGIEHFLLGSITEKVIRMANCPVFTVKSFGKALI
ncbi:MAG: universal stress protein [Calditrichaeota bacterium]|nr:MAG: universal stress protein [Calditrichota bacterium]